MSAPLVIWFRNGHEHSLHYFKFGLMQLAAQGEIKYREIQNDQATDLIAPHLCKHEHRRTAFAMIEDAGGQQLILLDGEDSIFQTSSLIRDVDRYYSCSYRREFFTGEPFGLALPWQTPEEIAHYEDLYQNLQETYAGELAKGRPLMPIGPAMEMASPTSFVQEKLGALRHKLSKLGAPWLDWRPQYERFQQRWNYLLSLRDLPVQYDVVLKDSLWGWPRHRIKLHRHLAELSAKYEIHSELHYREAEGYELGGTKPPEESGFPMLCGGGVPGNYEECLAASRLGVFATGFHYGCRNIVTLCWMLGIRTFCDPFSYQAIYDFRGMEPLWNSAGDWQGLEQAIETARADGEEGRKRRQRTFDSIACPRRAAEYLIAEALE